MKIRFIILAFLAFATLLCAQGIDPYLYLSHSSRGPDGNLRLRWFDITGNALGTECYYSANGAAWQSSTTEAYGSDQMQSLVPYEFGQDLRYRLRTEISFMDESVVYMHTPYMDADAFPPQLDKLGSIGTDVTGDSITVYAPVLDLTESWFGATQTKFYSALANVANSFPTLNSLFSYNLYLTTLSNPETVADTISYAMLYSFNIAGVISPGLYKMGMTGTGIPTFTRIGNIQSMVLGGKLYLSCNINDLISDPDFGAWPNSVNALIATSATMNLSIDPQTYEVSYGFGDYSTPGILIFQDYLYQVAQNTLPQCLNQGFDPISMTVSFDYYDADADFPLAIYLELPGGEITLDPIPGSYDYSQNVPYTVQLPFQYDYATLHMSDNNLDMVDTVFWFVGNDDDVIPAADISCRMPNPLNLSSGPCQIKLSGLEPKPVQVDIFNLRGQRLGMIFSSSSPRDGLEFTWDGKLGGSPLDSGMYFLRVRQTERSAYSRFTLCK
jgi:hypothetical protein